MGTLEKDDGNNKIIVENNRTIVKVSERGGTPVKGWGEGVPMTLSNNLKLSVFIENWREVQIRYRLYEND